MSGPGPGPGPGTPIAVRGRPSLRGSRPVRIGRTVLVATGLGVALAAGCGRSGPGGVASVPGTEPSTPPGALDARSRAELEALYRARLDRARLTVADADVRFMTRMIAHHTQALAMAALVPERAEDPSLRTLAARIDNAQRDEIAAMERWLLDRGQPVPEPLDALGVPHDGHRPGEAGPGMLSASEMRALADARGREFDLLFLGLMIRHHQGAVAMVHELFGTDGAALDDAVFKLASDVQVDQTSEITRMQRMLEERSAAPPHP